MEGEGCTIIVSIFYMTIRKRGFKVDLDDDIERIPTHCRYPGTLYTPGMWFDYVTNLRRNHEYLQIGTFTR